MGPDNLRTNAEFVKLFPTIGSFAASLKGTMRPAPPELPFRGRPGSAVVIRRDGLLLTFNK
jgi:hypothetical protein